MKILMFLLLLFVSAFGFSSVSSAQRRSYGGGTHTTSHGGTYSGGSGGSSHKGGTYTNPDGGHTNGTHK